MAVVQVWRLHERFMPTRIATPCPACGMTAAGCAHFRAAHSAPPALQRVPRAGAPHVLLAPAFLPKLLHSQDCQVIAAKAAG